MWIVTGTEKNLVRVVSSEQVDGLLPIGSYLTVTDETKMKHILYVEESTQKSLFEPSPLIVDAGLPVLSQDQECKNIILAREIRQFPLREDGMYNFIKPNQKAMRTTQDEINEVFHITDGYPLFLATHYLKQNSILRDDHGKLIHVKVPFDSLYLQTMICGQTGAGKTVAMKYLIEQFLNHEKGAVIAINVKSDDLLTMDKPTTIANDDFNKKIKKEWRDIDTTYKEINNFSIYIPHQQHKPKEGISNDKVVKITLRASDLEPNSLLGVLQNVTDRAAESLPNIFRYWKDLDPNPKKTFREFIIWFRTKARRENSYLFPTLSHVGEESEITLHPGTCGAILRSLEASSSFFDSPYEDCLAISEDNLLIKEKLSIIDLSSKETLVFGAVLLRHLLSKIYESKAILGETDIPVLIVIDEVHQFYRSNASEEALKELNAIARMGRSEKIGVIFASQNPDDLPKGLTTIVNTRIFFRSIGNVGRKYGVNDAGVDLISLESGYAIISNVSIPEIRLVKFPMSTRGVSS